MEHDEDNNQVSKSTPGDRTFLAIKRQDQATKVCVLGISAVLNERGNEVQVSVIKL